MEGLGCRGWAIGVYLKGAGVDCLYLKGAEHCDGCEEACGRVKGWVRCVNGSMRCKRSVGEVLESREVRNR